MPYEQTCVSHAHATAARQEAILMHGFPLRLLRRSSLGQLRHILTSWLLS